MTSVQSASSASVMGTTGGTSGAAVFSTGILGGQAGFGAQGLFGMLLAMLGGQTSADGSALSGLLTGKTGAQVAGLLSGQTGLLAGDGMASTQLTPEALAALLTGSGSGAQAAGSPLLALLKQLASLQADGQNLPTDTANLTADLSMEDVIAALQTTPKGQGLAALLSQSGSLDELQAKVSALSDADKKDVLDSMAALLAGLQMMQAPQQPVQTPVASADLAADSQVSEADGTPSQKTSALQTLADLLQKQLAGHDKAAAAVGAALQAKQEGRAAASAQAGADKALQMAMEKAQAVLGVASSGAADQVHLDAGVMQQIQAALTEQRRQAVQDVSKSVDDRASSAATTASATQATAPVLSAAEAMAKAHASQQKTTQTSDVTTPKAEAVSGLSGVSADASAAVATTPATPADAAHKGAFEALLKDAGAVTAKAADSANVKFDKHGAHIPVSDQVALRLSKATQDGDSRITIKLVPAELGRIEVRLDVATDGRVTAHFQVEQSSTLDLLQKDTKGLERALSEAGLKMDSQSLNFNMRGGDQRQAGANGQNMQQGSGQGQNQQGQTAAERAAQLAAEASGTDLELSWVMNPSRVNVRV